MFDNILNFIESLFSVIISILEFVISAINGFATFIASLPETFSSVLESSGGVLTMVFALFNNLPSNLWLGVLILLSGEVIAFLMWKNRG